MSAETLRRAASLMRERAEVAVVETRGAWECGRRYQTSGEWVRPVYDLDGTVCEINEGNAPDAPESCERVAEHIASWHPAVALAVADWLDTAGADVWAHGPMCECGSGCYECDDVAWQPHVRRALTVARAYMNQGGDSDV